MDKKTLACPSGRCKPGATLLGVVESDGHVAFFNSLITIDEEFFFDAQRERTPEKKFRFSNTCIQGACKQWDENKCGIIEQVFNYLEPEGIKPEQLDAFELPHCPIRSECRWFNQRGKSACYVCPLVITDLTSQQNS